MSVSAPHLHVHTADSAPASASAGVQAPPADERELRQALLRRERRIDEELAQSFPASDPPSWVHGTTQ